MTEDGTAMAGGQDALGSGVVVVERVVTPRGELVLRRAQAQYEIIHKGVFLMDTRNGASERLLVRGGAVSPARVMVTADGAEKIGLGPFVRPPVDAGDRVRPQERQPGEEAAGFTRRYIPCIHARRVRSRVHDPLSDS